MSVFDVIKKDTAKIATAPIGAGVQAQLKHFATGNATVYQGITVIFGDHQSVVTEDANGIIAELTAQVCAPVALWPNAAPAPAVGDQLIVATGPDAGSWRIRTVAVDCGAYVFDVVRHEVRTQRGAGR